MEHFVRLIETEQEKQRELEADKETLTHEISKLENVYIQTENSLLTLKESIDKLTSAKDKKLIDMRRKLQKTIRELVEVIKVYPKGQNYLELQKEFDALDSASLSKDEKKKWNNRIGRNGRYFRQAIVDFRGGGFLSFMHDEKTERLKVMLDFEPSDDENIFGTIHQSGLTKISKTHKMSS